MIEPIYTISGNSYLTRSINIIYGDSFELPIPVKEGFEFVGWFDENDNQITSGIWNYNETMTLFARWNWIYNISA